MTLYAYDVDGYVGDVASVGGWADIVRVMLRSGDPVLIALANEGCTQKLEELISSLQRWGKDRPTPQVDAVRLNLIKLARKCKLILIISDGVGVEADRGVRKRKASSTRTGARSLGRSGALKHKRPAAKQ
jgi:hypothetical protein